MSSPDAPAGDLLWRHLAFDLLRVTRAGACAAAPWRGRDAPAKADEAAAQAMRTALDGLCYAAGTIVSGEGEKDGVPHLAAGERFGAGGAPVHRLDVAVDPIDGTTRLSAGLGGALSTIAVAPSGALLDPGRAFYMDKLVAGPAASGHLDPEADTAGRLAALAEALDKPVSALVIFVLDKPRHRGLADEIRAAGARALVHPSGDVAGALRAVLPGTGIDGLMGVGGVPEGLLAACAVRALGGVFFGRLAPQGAEEAERLRAAGRSPKQWHGTTAVAGAQPVAFSATGITGGALLDGATPQPPGGALHTETLLAFRGAEATAGECHRVRSRPPRAPA